MSQIGSLLGRWHQWRAGYSTERKFARVALLHGIDDEDDGGLERLTMASIEDAFEQMPPELRLALQHVARSECLGVEVIMSNRLPTGPALDTLCAQAVRELERRLAHMGLI